MLNYVNHTRDEGLKVWVIDVDAAFAMPWEVEHDYFAAAFPEAIEEGKEVVACVGGYVGYYMRWVSGWRNERERKDYGKPI